jgi:DNA-binding LacI/PurR family transcriptional regulator
MAVIKDVAKLAEVSTGTVSKYFKNPDSLRENTKIRVKNAVDELMYKPNPLARSLRTRKTNTISIITPDIVNPFFGELYSYIRTYALQGGYNSFLYTPEDNPDLLKGYLTSTSIRQLDGVILCFIDHNELFASFIEEIQTFVPTVILSWNVSSTKFNSVCVDVFEGIYKATVHLLSLGHRQLAYIGESESSRISMEKYNGFAKAMHEAGCEINENFVFYGGDTLQSGYLAARKMIMNTGLGITGIVAEDDFLAIGAMKYLLQKGIKIPDEIALTGFDDILLSRMYEPSLSTVSLPKDRLGKEAVRLLLAKIEKPGTKKTQIIVNTEFIERGSTNKNGPMVFNF